MERAESNPVEHLGYDFHRLKLEEKCRGFWGIATSLNLSRCCDSIHSCSPVKPIRDPAGADLVDALLNEKVAVKNKAHNLYGEANHTIHGVKPIAKSCIKKLTIITN